MRIGMRDEYDFKWGKRGKFFRSDAVLEMPVYLDEHGQTETRETPPRSKERSGPHVRVCKESR